MQKAEKVVERIRILEMGMARASHRNVTKRIANTDIETSWMMIPANMMWAPVAVFPGGVLLPAEEANPPPTA